MKKLLVVVSIWSLALSPFAWAEDETTAPSKDTVAVVETVLDPTPVIETTEQTQNPVDASIFPESSEHTLGDILQASEEIILPESEIIALPDETIVNEQIHTQIGDSSNSPTQIINDITEIQTTDPVTSLTEGEETDAIIVLSDTELRTISEDQ